MKLDAWLKQKHPLEERLRVIERLCQAINEIHDRGDVVGGLEPSRISLGAEGQCDLSGARKRRSRPPYAPPEGDRSLPNLADIYAAGAVAWEILAGRTVQSSPAHLAEVRPDLQRELADAVMACLEESPDWRPNDLTYLAQMAAARQRAAGGPARSSRAPLPPRTAPKPLRRGPSRRTWPLLLALVVVVGLAALAGRQYLGDLAGLFSTTAEQTAPTPRPPARATTPTPEAPKPTPPATRQPPPRAAATPATKDAAGEAEPTTETASADVSGNTAPGGAEPSGQEVAPEPPALPPRDTPAPPPAAGADPPPPSPATAPARPTPTTVPSEPAPPAVQPPPSAEPLPPAVLNAVAPPTVKRPGKVLVDLRGTGLGPGHRARILPVKKVPWGIKVVRQKLVDDTLMTVLLELEDSAEPGEYGIAVEDGRGNRSEPLIFEVTK